jgi:hypothetical protein
MINIEHERLVTLAAAARLVPNRKSEKGVAPSTLWRWHIRGVRGVKLETLLVGGVRYTSTEAIRRFYDQTTAAADGRPPNETVASRKRAMDAAERELIAAGL